MYICNFTTNQTFSADSKADETAHIIKKHYNANYEEIC